MAISFITTLSRRRENLGISQARLAEMAGVSLPTVQRFLSGNGNMVAFETVAKIAEILGVSLSLQEDVPEEQLLMQRARARAKELAVMVQGTSSLEAQGLSPSAIKTIEQRLLHELLKGSRSRLWSA